MKIWLTRHGQTRLNKARLMQGRTDEPLNERGIQQARQMRRILLSRHDELVFDAVYSSPLNRAVVTASVIGGVSPDKVITDERIIETDFGRYEQKSYLLLGPAMSLYWAVPEIFPVPDTVESIASMTARAGSFLRELEQRDYQNVLVACHGGILRALCGILEDRPKGIKWRPKPHNCEVRVYEVSGMEHRHVETLSLKDEQI